MNIKTIVQIEELSKDELLNFIESSIDKKLSILRQEDKRETITTQEAAILLNCAVITVHQYIKKGLLPAVKVGRKYIIRQSDLEKSLSEVKSLKYKRA